MPSVRGSHRQTDMLMQIQHLPIIADYSTIVFVEKILLLTMVSGTFSDLCKIYKYRYLEVEHSRGFLRHGKIKTVEWQQSTIIMS